MSSSFFDFHSQFFKRQQRAGSGFKSFGPSVQLRLVTLRDGHRGFIRRDAVPKILYQQYLFRGAAFRDCGKVFDSHGLPPFAVIVIILAF